MPKTSIRLSDELYDKIQQESELNGLSMSDFIRQSVESQLLCVGQNGGQSVGHNGGHGVNNSAIDLLREQLSNQHDQIRQLTQELFDARQSTDEASRRHDTIVLQMTQQLNQAQMQLEDLRHRPSWWQRLFGAKA